MRFGGPRGGGISSARNSFLSGKNERPTDEIHHKRAWKRMELEQQLSLKQWRKKMLRVEVCVEQQFLL